ncbi:response regulator [Rheinheimera sp. MM224]|uniref:Hpt domain-containing response regulator n=1 Tax=Rheinheimera sp. MM224 TaxID=3019969 RepID=UPI0021F888A3|nr:response regulator [Rheinheimera sp. MM224]CAI3801617.1 Sensor histidine kinase RcsC [Rheinheimera sp. MM224]
MNLLFAEDDALLAQLFQLQAESAGYQVVWAENGDVAVQQALSYQFDLIFMDIQMPVLDGISAMQMLRQLGYDRPIIAMSAEEVTETGFDVLLKKPLQWQEVQQQLTKFKAIPSLELELPQELKEAYLAHAKQLLQQLVILAEQQNWIDFMAIVHQLKGSAASFDLVALSQLADQLQNEWKTIPAEQRTERAIYFLEQCKACKLK